MNPDQVVQYARVNLLAFATIMNPNYDAPDHLISLAKLLHAVERGDESRLLITFPPRHGKSEQASVHFPAWYLGKHPDRYIIGSSYGQELSSDFGRKVRRQLEDPLFAEIFPECQLSTESHASNRFETSMNGTYFGVGIGGPITGRGAHLLLIDDPIKNRQDAESDAVRREFREWYRSVAYTRLMPGGAIVVIMQRWNDEDPIGWLLREHAHDNWKVINFPAERNGKALWPERYPMDVLMRIKKTARPYVWASQYQQQPIARETRVLNVDKIQGYDTLPEILMVFTACDPAISKNTKACNTAFCTLGFGSDGHVYDLETRAAHWGFFETLNEAKLILHRQKSNYLGVESNQYQAALVEACQRFFPQVTVVDLRADKDKFRRAKTVSHFIDQGLFHTNNRELIDEIANFDPEVTGEAKKDRVDAMVMALHMVQKYAPTIEKEVNPVGDEEGLDSHQLFFKKTREWARKQRNGEASFEEFSSSETNIDPEFY